MYRNFGYLEVAFQSLIYNSEAIKQPAVYSNITHFVAKKTEKNPNKKISLKMRTKPGVNLKII